jgi:hypothetical protein
MADAARGYNEDEIRAAEEEFDALINAGLLAAAAAAAAAVAAEPIAATVTDATIAPALTVWNTYVAEVLVPALTRIFKGSAAVFVETAESTLLALSYDLTDIAPIDEPAAAWMASASNRLRAVSDIVWAEIREQLVAGVKVGDGIPELAQRVRDAAGFSEPRARATARTEVAAASNGGSITQARSLGLDMDKQWEATSPTDGRTRVTHLEAHHQTVDLGAKFEVGGDLLDFPGDPTGQAEEVINCRCAVTYLNIRRRQEAPEVAAGFVEAEHPRGRGGKFAEKPGGGGSGLSASVDSGISKRRALAGGGMAIVDLVEFNDGKKAVRKLTKPVGSGRNAKDQQDAEELSALVAEAVGAKVPGVLRTGPNEVFMEFVEDDPAIAWMRDSEIDEIAKTPQGIRLGLLDTLIGNPDRHKGNFTVSDDMQTLTGIDHGAAWDQNTEVFEQGPFAANNFRKENPLSPDDVAEVRKRLEKLQPEFDRLGHPDWYQQTIEALDWVGNRAGGTDRIIP